MGEFNIRSETVDVEEIMRQIRARVREKRGVDYTEDQIRELATVRLEKFLDPKNLRSDLLEQFRRSRPAIPDPNAAVEPPYVFDDQTLVRSHRAPLRFMRRLLNPVLKLFFNPNTLNQVLHAQAQFNVDMLKRDVHRKMERAEWNTLYYEVLHNLVLETTRMSIEVKNLRMRVESLASRLDFNERRVRALEGVVQYRPEAIGPRDRRPWSGEGLDRDGTDTTAQDEGAAEAGGAGPAQAGEGGRRRRRRRRGRRGAGVPSDGPLSPPRQEADTAGRQGPEADSGNASASPAPDPPAAATTPDSEPK
jgi:hypothetical protein